MRQLLMIFLLSLPTLSCLGKSTVIRTSDGVDLFVEIKGKGQPCFYIHGGPGSGSYWMEKFFGDFLETHYQMIYLDQRGVGRSTTPANLDYSLQRMILDFEEVRQALQINQWVTLGHSFGGILQTAYALKFPDAHKSMIMVNCTLNMRESFCSSWIPYASGLLDEKAPSSYDDTADITKTVMSLISRLHARKSLWRMTFANPDNEEKLAKTYTELSQWNNSFSSNAFAIADYWSNYKEVTAHIQVPVLFFYGKNDMTIGPDHYHGVAFPVLTLQPANCGHMPFLEGREELQEAILRFM